MIIMDLNSTTWVGNLYGKFEAMCLEVEEHMRQDTLKYVENQVQTVGQSVKRFYSDVMQDLSATPIDAVKSQTVDATAKLPYSDVTEGLNLEQQDDVGIHKKPKSGVKEDVSKANIQNSTQVPNKIDYVFKGAGCVCRLQYPSSVPTAECVQGKCPYLNSRKDNDSSLRKQSNVGIKSETSELVKSSLKDLRNLSNHEVAIDQTDMISPVEIKECASEEGIIYTDEDKIGLLETAGEKGAKMRLSFNSGLAEETNGSSEDITQCAESAEEMLVPRPGRLEDRDSGAIERGKETVKPLDELEVEETCVIVDPTKSCFVSQIDIKHRSYKKKIREAFSTKKKSARKQEYEQLAIKYGEINTRSRSNQQSAADPTPKLTIQPQKEKSLRQDISESEWELL